MTVVEARPAKKKAVGTSTDPRRLSRQRLLNATIEHVRQHGMGDITLRQLAVALGTSHRMLLFHFKSKAGLIMEVVRAAEAEQKRALDELRANPGLAPVDRLREAWNQFLEPEMIRHERLFFEAYAYALQNRPRTNELLTYLIDDYFDPLQDFCEKQLGFPREQARTEGRIIMATTRGLIMDLLATGDRDSIRAAFEQFLARYDRPRRSSDEPH
jgi:AcrR family transcriptional regulator